MSRRCSSRLNSSKATPRPRLSDGNYQSSFNPNWIWRDVVDVLVIWPAVGFIPDGVNVIATKLIPIRRVARSPDQSGPRGEPVNRKLLWQPPLRALLR